jgi:hypothetical protein
MAGGDDRRLRAVELMDARDWDAALGLLFDVVNDAEDLQQQCLLASLISECTLRRGDWENAAVSATASTKADPLDICRLHADNALRTAAAMEWRDAASRSSAAPFMSCCVAQGDDAFRAIRVVPAKKLLFELRPVARMQSDDKWYDLSHAEVEVPQEMKMWAKPLDPRVDGRWLAYLEFLHLPNDCAPNCAVIFCGSRALVVASRELRRGEPLTISRIDSCQPHSFRRRQISSCKCARCEMAPSAQLPPGALSLFSPDRAVGVLEKLAKQLPKSDDIICAIMSEARLSRRTGGETAHVCTAH